MSFSSYLHINLFVVSGILCEPCLLFKANVKQFEAYKRARKQQTKRGLPVVLPVE